MPNLPLASASSDMIRWCRVLLTHAGRSTFLLSSGGAGGGYY